MTTNPKSPEAIAEELAIASGLTQYSVEQRKWVAQPLAVAALLDAMHIQREHDAQACESNFKPEDDCEFECHRADAAAIRGAKP